MSEVSNLDTWAAQLQVVRELRGLGAVEVQVGALRVRWAEPPRRVASPTAPPEPEPELTPEEAAAKRDELLYWSAE